MIFSVIRLLFFAAVVIAGFVIIKKRKNVNMRRALSALLIAAVILTTVSGLIPVENAFISFSTPEKAYLYNHFGRIRTKAEGKESVWVVGTSGNTENYAVIPKSGSGYKIGMGQNIKRSSHNVSDGIVIDLYCCKTTGEYYITVFDTDGGKTEITDNRKSVFEYTKNENTALHKYFYTYYAYIDGFADDYSISVNGKEFKL